MNWTLRQLFAAAASIMMAIPAVAKDPSQADFDKALAEITKNVKITPDDVRGAARYYIYIKNCLPPGAVPGSDEEVREVAAIAIVMGLAKSTDVIEATSRRNPSLMSCSEDIPSPIVNSRCA
jgi:hypothetical protein